MRFLLLMLAAAAAVMSCPAAAESPRELLVSAAFNARSKPAALVRIEAALKAADAAIARNAGDREARLQRAIALSYRGKLKRNRGDILAARSAFEALVASNPRDAEAQIALAGWHLGAIIELGPLVARTALGARKNMGLQALERAVMLGGGRALFPAYASLTRIQLNPGDVASARKLAEAALKGRVAVPVDGVMQRQVAALLPALRPDNGKSAASAAKKLLPFGQLQ